jgi:hydrogenase nickel incorporation protein HypB
MSDDARTRTVRITASAMSKNDEVAAANRERFARAGKLAVNLISSPGSGKTTLLEALAERLGSDLAVIEGDVQTRRDAERVAAAGAVAHQVETGGACHLDARAVSGALDAMALEELPAGIVVIENVGNLVCPSSYDLGEHFKAALLSVPEGDDKVLKYPSVFRRIGALVVTKVDLLPHLEFDVDRVEAECRSLNDAFDTFRLSARTGEGVDRFCEYLQAKRSALTASSRA